MSDPILVRAEMAAEVPQGPARAPAVTEVQSPELPALCVGCGMHHGSQGAELQCLRNFVKALRELAARRDDCIRRQSGPVDAGPEKKP